MAEVNKNRRLIDLGIDLSKGAQRIDLVELNEQGVSIGTGGRTFPKWNKNEPEIYSEDVTYLG